jgi:hypothetical protein
LDVLRKSRLPDEQIEEYRRKAEECRAKAAKATDDVARAEWIIMAQGWEALVRQAEKDDKAGLTLPRVDRSPM